MFVLASTSTTSVEVTTAPAADRRGRVDGQHLDADRRCDARVGLAAGGRDAPDDEVVFLAGRRDRLDGDPAAGHVRAGADRRRVRDVLDVDADACADRDVALHVPAEADRPRVRAGLILGVDLHRAGGGDGHVRRDRRDVRAARPVDGDGGRDVDAAAVAVAALAARLAAALVGRVLRLRERAVGLARRVRVVLGLVVGLLVRALAGVGLALRARLRLRVGHLRRRRADGERRGGQIARDIRRRVRLDHVDRDGGADRDVVAARRRVRVEARVEILGRGDRRGAGDGERVAGAEVRGDVVGDDRDRDRRAERERAARGAGLVLGLDGVVRVGRDGQRRAAGERRAVLDRRADGVVVQHLDGDRGADADLAALRVGVGLRGVLLVAQRLQRHVAGACAHGRAGRDERLGVVRDDVDRDGACERERVLVAAGAGLRLGRDIVLGEPEEVAGCRSLGKRRAVAEERPRRAAPLVDAGSRACGHRGAVCESSGAAADAGERRRRRAGVGAGSRDPGDRERRRSPGRSRRSTRPSACRPSRSMSARPSPSSTASWSAGSSRRSPGWSGRPSRPGCRRSGAPTATCCRSTCRCPDRRRHA